MRENIERLFTGELAGRLEGPDAAVRAEMFAAMLTGIAFLRAKIGTPALAEADGATLARYTERVAEALLDHHRTD